MKKVDYKKLALLGITGGLLMASQVIVAADVAASGKGTMLAGGCGGGKCGGFTPTRNTNTDDTKAPAPSSPTSAPQVPETLPNQKGPLADNAVIQKKDHTLSPHKGTMTEADLIKSLNQDSRDTFNSLSPEGKALALQLANQACKGQNSCKGLNSCKTANNSCAGQGGCKGQSNCAFKDKNQAVKVAAMKMASKRADLTK